MAGTCLNIARVAIKISSSFVKLRAATKQKHSLITSTVMHDVNDPAHIDVGQVLRDAAVTSI